MSKNMPLVSVVTPSFNQAGFIEETIRSVLSQDYPNIEYIIIDGGSTDGTLDILRRYDDQLTWFSEPDEGQSDALNKGFRLAQGTILGWLNSDDTYTPGAVRAAVDFLASHPQVGMVYGACNIINEHSEIVGHVPSEPFEYERELLGNYIPQPATFIRKHVMRDVGYLDVKVQYAMDYDLWLRIGLSHQIANLPKTLANFRLHSASKTMAEHTGRLWPAILTFYNRIFSDPRLPETYHALKAKVYRRAHWRAGIEYYLTGRRADGHYHCRQAVEQYALDSDLEFATSWLFFEQHEYQQFSSLKMRPASLVEMIQSDLGSDTSTACGFWQTVWERFLLTKFYTDYQNNNLAGVRYAAPRLLRLGPRRVLDRGFVSIWLQALVGRKKRRLVQQSQTS